MPILAAPSTYDCRINAKLVPKLRVTANVENLIQNLKNNAKDFYSQVLLMYAKFDLLGILKSRLGTILMHGKVHP